MLEEQSAMPLGNSLPHVCCMQMKVNPPFVPSMLDSVIYDMIRMITVELSEYVIVDDPIQMLVFVAWDEK